MDENFYFGINNKAKKIKNAYYVPGLPRGYQQIEYIETDGEAYIMTTHEPSANTRTIAEFSDFDITKDCQFFGVRINSDLQTFFNWAKWDNESAFHFASYIGNSAAGISVSNDYNGEKFKVDKNKFSCTVTINNQSYSVNNTENTFEKFNVYGAIFGFTNQDGTVSVSQPGVKLYSYQTYNGDTLRRNYVPCYTRNKKLQKVFGLYETVEKKFYTSEVGSLEPTEIIPITQNKAKKITRMYIGVDNKAKICYNIPIEIPELSAASTSVTYSSQNSSYPAWRAFNGDDSTEWRSSSIATVQNCTYNFSKKIYIEKIKIKNYASAAEAYKFYIKASNNNTDWDILYTSSTTLATNREIDFLELDENYRKNSYQYFRYESPLGSTSSKRVKGLYVFNVIGYEE